MNMKEKMARAGYEQAIKNTALRYPNDLHLAALHPWENQSDALKADWLSVVDAQIDALMEPTEGMQNAAFAKFDYNMDDTSVVWEAMIGAAKEGK